MCEITISIPERSLLALKVTTEQAGGELRLAAAMKLRRKSRNLLGGRAVDFQLHPLTTNEVPDIDPGRAGWLEGGQSRN